MLFVWLETARVELLVRIVDKRGYLRQVKLNEEARINIEVSQSLQTLASETLLLRAISYHRNRLPDAGFDRKEI